MVGGCRGIFYKGVGEKIDLTEHWWKNSKVHVGSLSKKTF